MKAIGILVSALIWIIMAGIPVFCFSYACGSDTGVGLVKYYPISFVVLLITISIYGAMWFNLSCKFYIWFKSKLK